MAQYLMQLKVEYGSVSRDTVGAPVCVYLLEFGRAGPVTAVSFQFPKRPMDVKEAEVGSASWDLVDARFFAWFLVIALEGRMLTSTALL